MDWIAIGKRIRQQREYMGLTREQFAEQIDVTPKFCSDIETGAKGMSIPTLCRISKVLRLSTDYIPLWKNGTGKSRFRYDDAGKLFKAGAHLRRAVAENLCSRHEQQ